jgi:hypothetical protein
VVGDLHERENSKTAESVPSALGGPSALR